MKHPLLAAAALAAMFAMPALAQTRGPAGEAPTPTTDLTLSAGEIATLKGKDATAALLWHTSSDFVNAVTAGATDTFAGLGVRVVATTDAGFDPAKQQSDVATVMAKKPSAILALPLDPVTAAAAFRPAIAAGVKLVLLSNVPAGFKYGTDYVAVVTDDLYAMGSHAADALASAIGGKGKIGYIFHDAAYYVTNQRDQSFKKTIEDKYKDIAIVESQGITAPDQGEKVAQAMLLKHPDLDGIYVTWAEPAEGVLSALREAGNTHVKIVTLDLSEPLALDMVKGGNVAAIVADQAYALGAGMATAAGYGLLGKAAPPFIVAPVVTVTKANVEAGYQESLHRAAPESVVKALHGG
jgi:ribose transport system substrate-binding protein